MKRQFYPSPSGFRRAPGVAVVVATGVLVLGVLFVLLRVVAPGILAVATTPLWQAGTMLGAVVESSTGGFTNTATLTRERDALAAQNQVLSNENAVLAAKLGDFALLMGTATSTLSSIKGTPAGVLSRPPITPYDTLIVQMPAGRPAHQGDMVMALGGIPVGTVESVQGSVAHVQLYSSPGVVTAGWIGTVRAPVELTGVGSGAFTATLSKDAVVAEGDSVYSPGPGALPLGTVVRVDRDPSSPLVTLQIRPLVNPFSLTWVDIVPHGQ